MPRCQKRKSQLVWCHDEPVLKRHRGERPPARSTLPTRWMFIRTAFRIVRWATHHAMRTAWPLGLLLLTGRYGTSMYGAIVYTTKATRRLCNLALGFQLVACIGVGMMCATYCAYVNDDLLSLLAASVRRMNAALDAGRPVDGLFGVCAAVRDLVGGLVVHTTDLASYRIGHELATAWHALDWMRRVIHAVARGDMHTLTKDVLRWVESHTQLLRQLRSMWQAVADVATDAVHETLHVMQGIVQTFASHLTRSWQQLTHWLVDSAHRTNRLWSESAGRLSGHVQVGSDGGAATSDL